MHNLLLVFLTLTMLMVSRTLADGPLPDCFPCPDSR